MSPYPTVVVVTATKYNSSISVLLIGLLRLFLK